MRLRQTLLRSRRVDLLADLPRTRFLSDILFGIGLGVAAVLFAERLLNRVGEEAVLDRLPFVTDI